ncbi:MAG TPA: hypothetical protein PLH56_06135 [Candidatus Omnitrophota bacterium]|nr:hypothetical protein [Candidatus Omnitrophota bacterium]
MSLVERLLDSLIQYLQKKRNIIRREEKKKRSKKKIILKKKKFIKKKSPPKIFKKNNIEKNFKKISFLKSVKFPAVKVLPTKVSLALKEKQKDVLIGQVTHFFPRIEVAVIKISDKELKCGERIKIEGGSGSFTQKVESMQRESVDVKVARKGQLIGLKVKQKVSEGAKVFKLL